MKKEADRGMREGLVELSQIEPTESDEWEMVTAMVRRMAREAEGTRKPRKTGLLATRESSDWRG